uniref:Uncharacterized protein n=1 Tax=Oryza brachyantha TaxID=4533 RepID=J3LDN5_ORYBR
ALTLFSPILQYNSNEDLRDILGNFQQSSQIVVETLKAYYLRSTRRYSRKNNGSGRR